MIKLKRIKSITSKILISYLVVVICSTLVTTLSFHSILYGDLERRAKQGLLRQALDIAMVLKHDNPDLILPLESLRHRPISGFFVGQPIESEYVVTNPQGYIVYSSLPEQFPIGKSMEELPLKLPTVNTPENDEKSIRPSGAFLAVRIPIEGPPEEMRAEINKGMKGTVFTFAYISALEALNREILFLLVKSIFIALVIAIPIALLIARYLIKPLNALREYAKAVAKRQFNLRLDIKSDDELAELASSFNEMADQLERYDTSMRRFFQGASHEIKTPLMSIQGYAEGIKDGVFNDAQSNQALEVISKECQRLKFLVEEMINITKLQTLSETYNLVPCDLKQLFDEVVESLRGYTIEKKVRISFDLQSDIKIIGDREKLHRLFGNLIDNAIRHAKSQVRVKVKKVNNSSQIKIMLHDDGEGFRTQDLKHAFDYFYKGPNGSTGLGLSIAQIIVEEHNGTIKIQNASEGGALIEITLPFNSS